jgi:transposase
MLDQSQRTAILELAKAGHSVRAIATALGLSRDAVGAVLESGSAEVPRILRPELGDKWRDEILAQWAACEGNLVRVHEELVNKGAAFSYQTLTAFCRRHSIGHTPKEPAGHYDFKPGEEMQHDTSPHPVKIGGLLKAVQIASLVLCYSRMIFIQLYPCFRRFECKLFLTAALRYFGCTAPRCMIDNTHVVVLKGTGAEMVPVPEMAAFGERLGFTFVAHEKGDANRSARVEGHFNFVQTNFIPGRTFSDWGDLNRQAILWCDAVNAAHSPKLHASRRELFAAERPALKALPIWIPEVYVLHQRIVDVEGYVTVHTNRYSVPYQLIGRRMEVRELAERVEVYEGPRLVATHVRVPEPRAARVTERAHRPRRGERPTPSVAPEEQELRLVLPALASYVAALKRRAHGRGTLALRRLLRLVHDYPQGPLLCAVARAEQYGLFDLDRLERLVLRQIATDYFVLPAEDPDDPDKAPDTPDEDEADDE